MGSIGFFREFILFGINLQKGISYKEVRMRFKEIRRNFPDKKIFVSPDFIALTEDYQNNFELFKYQKKDGYLKIENEFPHREEVKDILFVQQVYKFYSKNNLPPKIPGFKLVENKFGSFTPNFLGVKLSNSPRGYNYAIYFSEQMAPNLQLKTID
jgi:hypothetical protein